MAVSALAGAVEAVAVAAVISHGIRAGLGSTPHEAKKAVDAGYFHLFRFNPGLREQGRNPFTLDSGEPSLDYEEFLNGEIRYDALRRYNPDRERAGGPACVGNLSVCALCVPGGGGGQDPPGAAGEGRTTGRDPDIISPWVLPPSAPRRQTHCCRCPGCPVQKGSMMRCPPRSAQDRKKGDRIGACVQIYIDGELAEEGEVWSGEL